MSADLTSLQEFMKRAQSAARTGSKEIRIPANEAMDLVAAIGFVIAENAVLRNRLGDTKKLIGKSIVIDGGKLS